MCKHCWDDEPGIHHKDWIRGWSDDGFEETPHKKKAVKKPKKKRKGCPGNEDGPHVYVWVTERYDYPDYGYGVYAYEQDVYKCCGCLKRHPRKRSHYRRIK